MATCRFCERVEADLYYTNKVGIPTCDECGPQTEEEVKALQRRFAAKVANKPPAIIIQSANSLELEAMFGGKTLRIWRDRANSDQMVLDSHSYEKVTDQYRLNQEEVTRLIIFLRRYLEEI